MCGLGWTQAFGANPPKLRYGFEPDRDHYYDITIKGEVTDRKGESKGILTCRAKEASERQFVLETEGTLSQTWETTVEDH